MKTATQNVRKRLPVQVKLVDPKRPKKVTRGRRPTTVIPIKSAPDNIGQAIDIESAIEKKTPYGVVRCGDCLYFKDTRHPNYDAPCANLGRLAKGVAPKCYADNVNALKGKGTQMTTALNVLASQLTGQQMRTIGTMLMNADKVKKLGFDFLERVFFAVGSPRYLSNYYSGHVVGTSGYAKQVMVIGAQRTGTGTIIAHLARESILSMREYTARRDALVAKGLIYDPGLTQKRPPVIDDGQAEKYVPPMLDTSPEFLEAKAAGSSSKRKKSLAPPSGSARSSVSLLVD